MDREALADRYRRLRRRTRELFDIVRPEAYTARPISLRHPVVFYEGHLPAFAVNTLLKRGLGRPGVDDGLERLFERGIDPEDEAAANLRARAAWPAREDVRRFAEACDALVLDAIAKAPIEQPGHPLLHEAQAVHAILEHEAMHQETMLYMWHQLPYDQKRAPERGREETSDGSPPVEAVTVPRGRATIGARPGEIPFGWDNEFPAVTVDVPAFEIDVHDVTNERFLEFVEAGGYRRPEYWTPGSFAWIRDEEIEHPRFWGRRDGAWTWRGMFEEIDLPPSWPAYVTHAEAEAYARWKGRRLPSEAEYHRAAFGDASGTERRFPWGDAAPDASRGTFDFASWNPVPAGRRPAGASAWGVHDLVGNGWEWTSSTFGPLPGFRPLPSYPEYSADFFDGRHFVMKGASPATDASLLRRSFRNWFRPRYPYVYAAFRCARSRP